MTPPDATLLPAPFARWFAARGWTPFRHQLEMLAAAAAGRSALLIAPTGGGKTLAGFLPSLVELSCSIEEGATVGLHTLYIYPLKALAVDIHRNLEAPIAEIGLPIRAETRTGDTPQSKRERQRKKPPHLLMTTPESLALLLSFPDAALMFRDLACLIVDELHALEDNKRGDLLALGMARLATLAPRCRRIGLSATVLDPARLARYLSPSGTAAEVQVIEGDPGPAPEVSILLPGATIPWSGHMATHAVPEIMGLIRRAHTTLVFVNTRAQAEIIFQALWRLNDDHLAIALHHGSLSAEQRRRVEAAMAKGALRAVVATSSLDLGVDWGAVDLVVQVGAPKGVTRLLQRIGRSNHRLDLPSRAVLVPANRFEYLECRAALDAVREHTLDGTPARPGGLEVLAQHVLGVAAAGAFSADDQFAEVRRAAPYAALTRFDFDAVLAFVATGGYALGAYDRYKRIVQEADGRWRIASDAVARRHRMNIGTIVEQPMVKVALRRGRILGEVEEYFAEGLVPGDTFLFAGRLLRFERLRDGMIEAAPTAGDAPKVPAYAGGRLPLSTHLAERVRGLLTDTSGFAAMPPDVRDWLTMQRWRSLLPDTRGLLVETFPRGERHYLVAYCFEGRNAHQTLGMLLTRRMERQGLKPLGFVATDYVLALWGLTEVEAPAALFDQDMLGDDLEAWMAESSLLRRTFRTLAVIAGLIERRHPGQEKTRRQVTFNADLIYDVLRAHEPNHVLLRATRADAAAGLTDIRRLADMLARVHGRIRHRRLDRISPLAVPVLLEIGKESVHGAALEDLLAERAQELVAEAMAEPVAETMALPL